MCLVRTAWTSIRLSSLISRLRYLAWKAKLVDEARTGCQMMDHMATAGVHLDPATSTCASRWLSKVRRPSGVRRCGPLELLGSPRFGRRAAPITAGDSSSPQRSEAASIRRLVTDRRAGDAGPGRSSWCTAVTPVDVSASRSRQRGQGVW